MFSDSKIDKELLGIVLILSMIGVLMVYSSSSFVASRNYGKSTYFLYRTLERLFIGIVGMILLSRIDYKIYKKYALHALLVLLVPLLITVIRRFMGYEGTGGANRWLSLLPNGKLSFQPSELVKVALVVYLASYLSKKQMLIKDFKRGLVPALIFPIIVVAMLVGQPSYGMAVSIIIICAIMVFVAGAKVSHLLGLASLSIPALGFFMLTTPHTLRRIATFFSANPNIRSEEYNIFQSLISFGNGGFNGIGLGESRQKFLYLPEAHTDFIFSVIGEELGLIGAAIVIVLFMWLFWKGLKIATCAEDRFGSYLAFGLTTMLFVFAIVNICVVLRIIPATGLPLPFISFGGTSLIVNLMAVGVLLNISKQIGEPRLVKINVQENNENAFRKGIFICVGGNRRAYNPGLQNSKLPEGEISCQNPIPRRQEGIGVKDSPGLGV